MVEEINMPQAMNDRALKIIRDKKVNVALLKECFEYPDDPFIIKIFPKEPRGLNVYNSTYEPGQFWREPLTFEEYNILKKALS